jgi:serine/threonine protein kinase
MNAMVMLGTRQMGLVGSMVAGRYELCAPLASGGMGDVYRGWDHRLCRPVAVKMLRAQSTVADQYEGASEHWWWEAWVMAASRSPHIVKVYDVIKDSERGYVIMELVQGIDLKQYVACAGPLAGTEALHIGIQVCQALRVMHTRGLIHCDIKPHNILRSSTGWVTLLDFGIARRAHMAGQAVTETVVSERAGVAAVGVPCGTVTYCSPEQVRGEPLTAATDLYSLGVVLYELLAGRPPFVGETPLAVAFLHTMAPVPALRSRRPELPPLVEQTIAQALEKRPARRFASAQAMQAVLERALVATTRLSERAAMHHDSTPTWDAPRRDGMVQAEPPHILPREGSRDDMPSRDLEPTGGGLADEPTRQWAAPTPAAPANAPSRHHPGQQALMRVWVAGAIEAILAVLAVLAVLLGRRAAGGTGGTMATSKLVVCAVCATVLLTLMLQLTPQH